MPKRANYDLPMLTKDEDPRLDIRADGEKGELDGYASKFWEVDSYGEATAPGCFAKSINDRGPKNGKGSRIHLRYEHRDTCGKHTMMKEDETGLKIEAYVSDDTGPGSILRQHLKDGIIYGLSIGFRRIRARPGTEDDPFDLSQAPAWVTTEFDPAMVTVLEEVRLMENSAVSFPAVDSAIIENYRSGEGLALLDRLISDLKAGTIRPEDKPKLEQLAELLPAVLAPTGQHNQSPEITDSDAVFALLELSAQIHTWTQDGRLTV